MALVLAACLTLLAYQFTYCEKFGLRLFEDGIKGLRDYRFKLGISEEEGIDHFYDYGEKVRTWQMKEEKRSFIGEERMVTWIEFENGEERL